MKKYILLKSKDDYSYEHYSTSPLSLETNFIGTAGEAIKDENGKITLFVDPRYHIQADIQTKGKDVDVVKMDSQYGFIFYLKNFLEKNSILSIPKKSTPYAFYKKLKENLSDIKIETYDTKEDETSIDNNSEPVFEVDKKITGKTLEDKIKKIKKDNFLITNLEEIAYLLNLRSYKTKNTSTFRAKLFIRNKDSIIVFCDYDLPKMAENIVIKKLGEFDKFIKNINDEIIVDLNSISLADFNLIKKPVFIKNNPVVKMASIKNKSEINHYMDSFRKLDCALYSFRKRIKEGLSEFELNEIFEEELIKNGAKTTSFSTILAIKENSSIIHYTANSKDKILKKGDIILLDCGGYYEGGYATDITRVFVCPNSKVEEDIKEIYTAVLKAQLNVYNSDLLFTDELHNLAQKFLKKYEKKGFYFPHGLGHGIGIPVHQAPPTLSNKIKTKLKNGNVFTIEPGLYKENKFGVRLENTVYLKDNIKISLSHFPYEEELINYDMLNNKEKKWLQNWQESFKKDF